MITKILFKIKAYEDYTDENDKGKTRHIGFKELEATKENNDLRFSIRNPTISWIHNDERIYPSEKDKLMMCHSSANWDAVVCAYRNIDSEKEEIIIYNADGSLRNRVSLPTTFVGQQEFKKHFTFSPKDEYLDDDKYPVSFLHFSGYYEHNGKYYLKVNFSKEAKREAISEARYLDTDTGEFLPFTKYICYSYPNQWDMTHDYRCLE